MERVRFQRPQLCQIVGEGMVPVDMHYHTRHSDGHASVQRALETASSLGMGLAITDHNEVSGAVEASASDTDVLVIPGMEVSSLDGPHILVYFHDIDPLVEFFRNEILPHRRRSPYLAIGIGTEEILERAREYRCVISAAHPYGYLLFNKGVQKCIDAGYLEPCVLDSFDAVEVICSGMNRRENQRATRLATDNGLGMTGGSDGHLISDLGRVVACGRHRDVTGFLGDVKEGRTVVIGKEKDPMEKVVMGSVVMTKYLPYLPSSLVIHWNQNIPRIGHFIRRRMGR